jgi:hypothetical protein
MMKRGVAHGNGKYIYEDEDIHEGLYQNDDLNGPGTISSFKKGRLSYYYNGRFKIVESLKHYLLS